MGENFRALAMKNELTEMENFQQLETSRQEELLQSFSIFEQNIHRQKIIAVIRESVRKFNENDFLQLLAKKDKWFAELKNQPKGEGYSKTDNSDEQGQQKTETNEKKSKYISKSSISVNFGKSILKSEADVEAYVKAVKKAYLAEIKQGKRVQI